MRFRIGIVGAGMIMPVHVQAVRSLPGAELTGIMDHGSGRGRQLAPELDPAGEDDLDAFVRRADIDVIAVASPSGTHLEAALAAAAAGKHCIVEKPMEITPARIDRMIEAHARAGTTLGGIFNTRYSEGAQLLRAAAVAGRFGRLTFASAVGPWWREQAYYDGSRWKGTRALDGGGALMNQGIHSIDLLQWLAGSRVTHVSGRVATLAHERIEVEDTGAAVLHFESGALGTLACTTSMWPGHFRTVTLGGSGGTAVLADGNLLEWRFRDETPADAEVRAHLLRLPGGGIGASDPSAGLTPAGHAAAFREFLAAIEGGRPPAVDGPEARKAVAIVCAVYESARQGGGVVAVA
jgi:predicted dehydrogenase